MPTIAAPEPGATASRSNRMLWPPSRSGEHGIGRVYDAGSDTTIIFVDTDGAFGADMEIKLTGNIALVNGNFGFGVV